MLMGDAGVTGASGKVVTVSTWEAAAGGTVAGATHTGAICNGSGNAKITSVAITQTRCRTAADARRNRADIPKAAVRIKLLFRASSIANARFQFMVMLLLSLRFRSIGRAGRVLPSIAAWRRSQAVPQ